MKNIESFIRDFCERFNININNKQIKSDTLLELDLNIFDIDIDAFLQEFSDYYKVSLAKFDWGVYGYPNGVFLLRSIRNIFGAQSSIFRLLKERLKHSSFSVRELEAAIESGFLE